MSVVLLCALLFALGLYGVLTRRDLVAILACVELMLGAASVQLVAFAATVSPAPGGPQAIALLLAVMGAAEAAVGLALVVASVRRTGVSRMDEMTEVEG